MKYYTVYKAGSERIGTLMASCITKACKKYIESLDREAKYELDSRQQASIRYADNHNVMGDFVIIEVP